MMSNIPQITDTSDHLGIARTFANILNESMADSLKEAADAGYDLGDMSGDGLIHLASMNYLAAIAELLEQKK